MEQVFAKIAETAKMLGIELSDARVERARTVAQMALAQGCSDEDAYEYARSSLLGASVVAA